MPLEALTRKKRLTGQGAHSILALALARPRDPASQRRPLYGQKQREERPVAFERA
jgi:hypothetical protein